jgi:hypothetical protein
LAKAVREVETIAESEYRRGHAAAGATLPGGNREGVLPWGGEGSNRVTEGTGKLPQGLEKQSFETASKLIRDTAGNISDDIIVQGSRAGGTAPASSDVDFAIRVPKDQFDALIKKYFKTPNPGSTAEITMNYSINNGIIQSGEAKLRSLRLELEKLLGVDVDISIILKDGPFDNGPMIKLP